MGCWLPMVTLSDKVALHSSEPMTSPIALCTRVTFIFFVNWVETWYKTSSLAAVVMVVLHGLSGVNMSVTVSLFISMEVMQQVENRVRAATCACYL